MGTVRLQDNLPMTGWLEKVWYQAPKEGTDYGPQLKLVGRWTEQTPDGIVQHGTGNIYVSAALEKDLGDLGLLSVAGQNDKGEPNYKLARVAQVRLLKAPVPGKTSKRTTVTLVDGPAPAAPAQPTATSSSAPSNGPASPAAAPAAAATTAADPDEAEKRRCHNALRDLLQLGDLQLAAMYLARRNLRASMGTEPEAAALQAAAATLMIQADRQHVQTFRGMGRKIFDILSKEEPQPSAVSTPPARTAPAPRSMAGSAPFPGHRSSERFDDEPGPEDEPDGLPF